MIPAAHHLACLTHLPVDLLARLTCLQEQATSHGRHTCSKLAYDDILRARQGTMDTMDITVLGQRHALTVTYTGRPYATRAFSDLDVLPPPISLRLKKSALQCPLQSLSYKQAAPLLQSSYPVLSL